jgi:hypothetical protein
VAARFIMRRPYGDWSALVRLPGFRTQSPALTRPPYYDETVGKPMIHCIID